MNSSSNQKSTGDKPVRKFVSEVARRLGTIPSLNPTTRSALGAFRAGDLKRCDAMLSDVMQQAQHSCNTEDYLAAASFRALYSKNPEFAGSHCETAALETWWRAERICRRTNRRLRLTTLGLVGGKYLPLLEKARSYIRRVLGDRPHGWADLCKHGNGSALGCQGEATGSVFKDGSAPYHVTQNAAQLLYGVIRTTPAWFRMLSEQGISEFLEIVEDCNQLAFVPKNWKTHRSICVEPVGNLYVQQGLGRAIALRLKRVGVNIFDDGQAKHQEYARQASIYDGVYGNGPVTLDLSMASDTLCAELVRYLMPYEWYALLDIARCHCTTLPDGTVVRTSKFSSMGNAATFPLETLVFVALARAAVSVTCHEGVVSAYGDDIIVPRGAALLLMELLRWCGFSANADKSYITGEFYESCGADYLRGVPVRPFYLKRELRSDGDTYFLANVVRDQRYWISVLGWDNRFCDYILRDVGLVYYGPVIDHERHGVPSGWFETDDASLWKTRRRGGITRFRCLREVAARVIVRDEASYITAMRCGGISEPEQKVGKPEHQAPGFSRAAVRRTTTRGHWHIMP